MSGSCLFSRGPHAVEEIVRPQRLGGGHLSEGRLGLVTIPWQISLRSRLLISGNALMPSIGSGPPGIYAPNVRVHRVRLNGTSQSQDPPRCSSRSTGAARYRRPDCALRMSACVDVGKGGLSPCLNQPPSKQCNPMADRRHANLFQEVMIKRGWRLPTDVVLDEGVGVSPQSEGLQPVTSAVI